MVTNIMGEVSVVNKSLSDSKQHYVDREMLLTSFNKCHLFPRNNNIFISLEECEGPRGDGKTGHREGGGGEMLVKGIHCCVLLDVKSSE